MIVALAEESGDFLDDFDGAEGPGMVAVGGHASCVGEEETLDGFFEDVEGIAGVEVFLKDEMPGKRLVFLKEGRKVDKSRGLTDQRRFKTYSISASVIASQISSMYSIMWTAALHSAPKSFKFFSSIMYNECSTLAHTHKP